jgi:ligand-binding SRPBCC domain-containing protein
MTSAITAYDRPNRFVDEQTRGPFRRWWHEHRFELRGGGTEMTDLVRFTSPAGPVGVLADRLVLTAYLRRLLETRNRWLKEQLEGG